MGQIKKFFYYGLLLFLLMSCGDEAKENANFTGPFAQCPPAPTQGFQDPICCMASRIDNGVNIALRFAGSNFSMPLSLGELIASKNPRVAEVCGETPTLAITEGLERINDSVERAQEGAYQASRLLCETNGDCDSNVGLDTKKDTKITQALSQAVSGEDALPDESSSAAGSFIPNLGSLGGSGGSGNARSASGGGSGGLGFSSPSKKTPEASSGPRQQEPFMADLNSSGGKYSSGGAKKQGGKGHDNDPSGKEKNPFESLLGSKKGKEEESRNLASLQFGADAENASGIGSPDPSDYFSRIDIYSNIFKIVEKKYRQKQMNWKIQESENY